MRGWLSAVLALAACGDNLPAPPDAPGVFRTYTVGGVVRYEDRAPLAAGADAALGDPTPVPARGVSVAVIDDASGSTLATSTTDDTGTYSLAFATFGGEAVHVLASATSTLATRPITVLRLDNRIHGFGGATFGAGVAATQDVLVTIASGEAQAFNVFDQMVIGFDRLQAVYADPSPPPLKIVWEKGNDDGTYYFEHAIHLLGDVSDDDGFDDTVMLHELGHYVEDVEGRTDSPGGSHDGTPTDPRLAWSEGWATYWALAVRDQPIYMDTNAGGGFNQNADIEVVKANAGGAIGQDVSEDMVAEILWDMGDAPSGDDDPLAGTHDADILVQQQYLKTAVLRNVGSGGADLVDWLDGWFVKDGLTHCTGVKKVVLTDHSFPYDFAGPGGTCP